MPQQKTQVKQAKFARMNRSQPKASRYRKLSAALLLLSIPAFSQASVVSSDANDRQSIGITIYNDNLALVVEKRKLSLGAGQQSLELRGVSAQMMPETVLLSSDANNAPRILEQNFDYDLLTPHKLLDKYVGQTIKIARTNPATGVETVESAVVLSNNDGPVVKIGSRIESNPSGRFIFDSIPANLRDVPTLSVLLDNPARFNDELQISYLSGGLSWKADYVASLDETDSYIDLSGWVTLNNHSGTGYQNASLQLVAGDVNRAPVMPKVRHRNMVEMAAVAMDGAAMQQESLFEYHLYTLPRNTSIENNQTKQVSLLNASRVPVTKNLILEGGGYYYQGRHSGSSDKLKLGVFVEFSNEAKHGLGMPLPKGVVRVYKEDSRGKAQFIGEDAIDHTGNKAKVKLKLGESFDVFAKRKQTHYEVIEKLVGGNIIETSHQITLTNGKKTAEKVIVRENLPGEWKIRKTSHPSKTLDARTAEWQIEVPAESSVELTYTVRSKF